VGGDASRFYQGLVKGKELLLQAQGGINWPLDSPWDSDGPSLLVVFALYKPTTNAKAVVAAIDEEVAKIAKSGVPAEELERTKTKMVSDLYSNLELPLNRATSLCLAQMFTGNAGSLNELPAKLEAVTGSDVQRVAAGYLTAKNRTVVDRKPAPKPEEKKAGK
jgi:predicted Zn-dependent peptidase